MKKFSALLCMLVGSLLLASCAFNPTFGNPEDYIEIEEGSEIVTPNTGYKGTLQTARSGSSSGLWVFYAQDDLHVYYDSKFFHDPGSYSVTINDVDTGCTKKTKSKEFDMKAGDRISIYYRTNLYREDGTKEDAFKFYIYFLE